MSVWVGIIMGSTSDWETMRPAAEVLEALVKRVGADRVLLGSDYPVGEPKPIEFIESCALSPQEKADIIGGNAARLFGIKVAA